METRICALPDDLLVQILLLVPTKDAVATSILSKRWRYVWTMLPELNFIDKEDSESIGCFIDKTLQLHKAPKLESLIIKLIGCRPVDVDVVKWVEEAVNLSVEVLELNFLWETIEDPISFPKSLYTCDTLVELTLSNEILVDVSSSAHLPSLLSLSLCSVVYKDEESLVRLLSSSPVLKYLTVHRHEDDNLTNFTVRVSSLQSLFYWRKDNYDDDLIESTLVIDSPGLTDLALINVWEDYCLIENNMSCLKVGYITIVHNFDDKFLRCLSSLIHLQMHLTKSMEVPFCNNTIKFSRLTECYFCPAYDSVDWLEPLLFLLQNSPKLKTLTIDTDFKSLPPSWNQPSSIPGCLSSHLETLVWWEYEGRENEKKLVTYILANSKCLKKVEISLKATCNNLEETQKELESIPRISTSSRLLFRTQIGWRFLSVYRNLYKFNQSI